MGEALDLSTILLEPLDGLSVIVAMLNTRALSDLFLQNCDTKLCQQWWLMTPNGTLLTHSSSSKVSSAALRRQVATVALAWQEHDAEKSTEDVTFPKPAQLRDELRALTIEGDKSNIIVTRVQSQMLLALEGGVPPRRPEFEVKTIAEGPDDQQYPAEVELNGTKLDGTSSRASSITGNAALSILRLQRRKLEAMANAIADNFEQTGFQLPTEGAVKFF